MSTACKDLLPENVFAKKIILCGKQANVIVTKKFLIDFKYPN